MRFSCIVFLLALVPALAMAADDPCTAPVHAAVDDCCQAVESACATVKYRPCRDWPEHRCALTCRPAEPCGCVEPPCHQPVMPCDPRSCATPVSMCHLPVVPLVPCDPCVGEPVLTGDRCLLVEGCRECGCS